MSEFMCVMNVLTKLCVFYSTCFISKVLCIFYQLEDLDHSMDHRYLFLILIKNILHWTYCRLLVVSPPSTRLTRFSTKQCSCFHSLPNIVFVLVMSNIMFEFEEHLYEHTQLACCVYVRPVVILGFSFQY